MKKQSTKTTKNKKVTSAAVSTGITTQAGIIFTRVPYTENDFKNSLLLVSVLVNTFILIAWLTTRVSSDFAYTIANALVQ